MPQVNEISWFWISIFMVMLFSIFSSICFSMMLKPSILKVIISKNVYLILI